MQLNTDMAPIKSLYFMSRSKLLEPGQQYRGMASFLSSDDHISAYFDNIHLEPSTHTYFQVRFQHMLSKYENSKIGFL